jgi:hypothetical protein
MKQIMIIFFIMALCSIFQEAQAQVYSPQLAGHFGNRIIYYPYGYYQGQVSNGIAHGRGTFYFRDGSFYHGNFANGWWDGRGVLVSPYYGYLTGCWRQGQYNGNCNNSYSNERQIERVIQNVQDEFPDNPSYTSVSPEGYNVKRIDPNTKMGRTLLGRYKSN